MAEKPTVMQSLKSKIDFIAVCIALLGMMCTGVYVYANQSSQLDSQDKDINSIKTQQLAHSVDIAQAVRTVDAVLAPLVAQQGRDVVAHETRINAIEKSTREDREVLLIIRNDIKWIREQEEEKKNRNNQ